MFGLLRGQLDGGEYVALLRALHAVYSALESRLDASATLPDVRPFYDRRLHRAASLADDLAALHGPRWADEVPPSAASDAYVERILCAAPLQLVAHAYVRYLGDLSGGQALAGVVARALGLTTPAGTTFYRFPEIADTEQFKEAFRAALDAWPLSIGEADAVVREAQEAFRLNVRVFEEVSPRRAPSAAPPPPPAA
jgi:heme oxygenase